MGGEHWQEVKTKQDEFYYSKECGFKILSAPKNIFSAADPNSDNCVFKNDIVEPNNVTGNDKDNKKVNVPELKSKMPRKRGRRGGKFIKDPAQCDIKDEDIVILSANTRGLKSKLTSLNEILFKKKVRIAAFQETNLQGKDKIKLKGFQVHNKNRDKQNSGVSTAVADDIVEKMVKVGEGEKSDDEYIIHRLDTSPPLVIINYYGGQESKASSDTINTRWARLRKDIQFWQEAGEMVLLMGDFNAHIGADEWGVPGNHPKISHGGKIIRSWLQDENSDLVLLNSSEKTVGGPWTREDPADPKKQSVLDLVICSKGLERFVKFMRIDSERSFAPRRVQKTKKGIKETFSDHYAIEVVLTGIKSKKTSCKTKKEVTYNYRNPGGWEMYKILTNAIAPEITELAQAVKKRKHSINQVQTEIDRLIHEAKTEAFGLTSRTRRQMERIRDGGKSADKEKLYARKIADLEHDIEQIEKYGGKSNMQKIWTIRKALGGGKLKGGEQAAAVLHPVTKQLATDPETIRDAHIKHVAATLKNNEENDQNAGLHELRRENHKLRMEEQGDKLVISKAEFDKVMSKAKIKNKKFMQTITRAGDKFRTAVWKYMRELIKREKFPDVYHKTTAVALYKGKGSQADLNSYRYIHTKVWGGRLADMLIVNSFREDLLASISGKQTGGIPGRSPLENIFNMKTVVGLNMNKKKPTYISYFDLSKFFDKEIVEDLAEKMFEAKITGSRYRTYHKLQMNTIISVKTPVGRSEEVNVGSVIGQGAAGAALCSAQAMDRDLSVAFTGCKSYMKIDAIDKDDDDLLVEPAIYQDDISTQADSMRGCADMHSRVSVAFNDKGLTCNVDKCGILVMGKGQRTREAREFLKEYPVKTMGQPTKIKKNERYLGDYLHEDGLKESVSLCIDIRIARAKGIIEEVLKIIEDPRAQIVAPIMLALAILKLAIEPMLLYASECWVNISKADENRLDEFQISCIRRILGASQNFLKAGLIHETGITRWSDTVKYNKMWWAYKLHRFSDEVMAKKYWKKNFRVVDGELIPCMNTLAAEVVKIAQGWKMPTPFEWTKGESHYKQYLKAEAFIATYSWAQEKMQKSKTMKDKSKLNNVPDPSGANTQHYLSGNLHAARLTAQIRGNQLMKADTRHDANDRGQHCDCGVMMTTLHIISGDCPVYGDLVTPKPRKSAFADQPGDYTEVVWLARTVRRVLAAKLGIDKVAADINDETNLSEQVLKCVHSSRVGKKYLVEMLGKIELLDKPKNLEGGQIAESDQGDMDQVDDIALEWALELNDDMCDDSEDERVAGQCTANLSQPRPFARATWDGQCSADLQSRTQPVVQLRRDEQTPRHDEDQALAGGPGAEQHSSLPQDLTGLENGQQRLGLGNLRSGGGPPACNGDQPDKAAHTDGGRPRPQGAAGDAAGLHPGDSCGHSQQSLRLQHDHGRDLAADDDTRSREQRAKHFPVERLPQQQDKRDDQGDQRWREGEKGAYERPGDCTEHSQQRQPSDPRAPPAAYAAPAKQPRSANCHSVAGEKEAEGYEVQKACRDQEAGEADETNCEIQRIQARQEEDTGEEDPDKEGPEARNSSVCYEDRCKQTSGKCSGEIGGGALRPCSPPARLHGGTPPAVQPECEAFAEPQAQSASCQSRDLGRQEINCHQAAQKSRNTSVVVSKGYSVDEKELFNPVPKYPLPLFTRLGEKEVSSGCSASLLEAPRSHATDPRDESSGVCRLDICGHPMSNLNPTCTHCCLFDFFGPIN